MTYAIRPATPDDVETILALIKHLAEYEKLAEYVNTTPEQLKKYGFGTPRYFETLLCETTDGDVIGMALYFFTFSTFVGKPSLYLEDLVILQEHRHRDAGKTLFKALARVALEHDCGRIDWSVLDWNTSAIRFYNALGAHHVDGWNLNRLERDAIEKVAAG